jgi:hypothetical protein
MDAGPRPALGAFGLVGQSIRLLFAHFAFLFPLAFVPALALAILGWIVDPGMGMDAGMGEGMAPGMGPMMSGTDVALVAAALAADVLVGFVVTGVMCLAALDAILGKRHTTGEYVAQTLRHLAPIVVLGIILYVLAGVGIALFVLPGLYVLARFLPWVAAIVFENAGWSGLTRAQELTEGYRWPLAGAIALFALLGLALAGVLAPFIALGATAGGLLLVPIQAAGTALYYALLAIFTALVYARLREIHEGMSTADIAASID